MFINDCSNLPSALDNGSPVSPETDMDPSDEEILFLLELYDWAYADD